ncbi:MAG: hypothetical protein ABSF77_06900 [Spirochaetia bacterium]
MNTLFPVDAQHDYAAVLDAARRIIGPLASDLDIHSAGAIPYNRAIVLLPILLYYDARRKPGRGREGTSTIC